ncbi:MAG: ArsA-related P-loop ATPase, partial [Chloroflexota bacterium]
PFTHSRRAMQEKYLSDIVDRFGLPLVQIPLQPQEIKGLAMLAELGEQIYQNDFAVENTIGQ